MTYQVKDWQKHFENNKSREREKCGFVCVPNKQHGMGFIKLMAMENGAAIYGVWICILGALSQQSNPRHGWLTDDAKESGTPWNADDLALKFRRPAKEIEQALEVLCSEKIGWMCLHGARPVPAECPSGALERKKEEKGNEEKEYTPSPLAQLVGGWFSRRPSTPWSDKELKSLRDVEKFNTPQEDLDLLNAYYTSDAPYKRRDIQTLLNNWNGEIDRARGWKKNPHANHSKASLDRNDNSNKGNTAQYANVGKIVKS